MIAGTTALALDGRPLIEVAAVSVTADHATLEGTAVAYEGTVLIAVMHGDQVLRTHHIQASVGGPFRGDWRAAVPILKTVTHLEVFGEEMEEGAETAHLRRVRIDLHTLPN